MSVVLDRRIRPEIRAFRAISPGMTGLSIAKFDGRRRHTWPVLISGIERRRPSAGFSARSHHQSRCFSSISALEAR
jgi:hypothetical protein